MLNYDRQGRLSRLLRQGDDARYEFRDFVRLSTTAYYPRVVVCSQWSEDLPDNPPAQVINVTTYTVEKADTDTPLPTEGFAINFPPKAINVRDYRYQTSKEPDCVSYAYDGVNSIEDESKQIQVDRL